MLFSIASRRVQPGCRVWAASGGRRALWLALPEQGVGVTSYGWQTLDSRRGPFGENRATVTVARLLVVFDQACQPVAASEAHAIVVERKVNVPPVGGDGVSGPVIESLLVPANSRITPWGLPAPSLRMTGLHQLPPLASASKWLLIQELHVGRVPGAEWQFFSRDRTRQPRIARPGENRLATNTLGHSSWMERRRLIPPSDAEWKPYKVELQSVERMHRARSSFPTPPIWGALQRIHLVR